RDQQDQEDYGIDYEIEVMLPKDKASGVIFKVQEKGTTDLKVNTAGDQISFSELDTERMRYYLQDLRIPAALVVVDVTKREAYWVRRQGNAEAEAAYRAAAEASQKTMTVHLPVANKLPDTLDRFLAEMVKCFARISPIAPHMSSTQPVLCQKLGARRSLVVSLFQSRPFVIDGLVQCRLDHYCPSRSPSSCERSIQPPRPQECTKPRLGAIPYTSTSEMTTIMRPSAGAGSSADR